MTLKKTSVLRQAFLELFQGHPQRIAFLHRVNGQAVIAYIDILQHILTLQQQKGPDKNA